MRPALLAVLLAAVSVGSLPIASADDKDRKREVDASIDALHQDLADTDRELAAAVISLRTAEAKLGTARKRVEAAQTALDQARRRDQAIAAKLALAQDEEAHAEQELQGVQAELEEGRTTVNSIARQAYKSGQLSTLSVVMGSESPADFTDRLVLMQDALRSQGQALQQLAATRADIRSRQVTLQEKRQLIADLKAESEANVKAKAAAEAEAESAQREVEQLVASAAAAKAAVEAQKASEEKRLAQMRRESAQLGALIRQKAEEARRAAAAAAAAARERESRASSAGSGSSSSGGSTSSGGGSSSSSSGGSGLSHPVSGPITSAYGMRVHPVTGVYKLHDGTDFGAACGTPIHAAADGTVIWAQGLTGYGNQLAIDHGTVNGVALSTSYSHQERFAVSAGQHVTRGQVIGYVGSTGYSTGCHLHFMVYVNGAVTNPMGWL
nr:M23 family metallopeptidase [Motilibacter aurantiacus]